MRTSEAISIWTVYGIWLDQHSSQIGFFLHEKTFFLHTCTPYSELPSNIRTMIMSFMLQCNHAYKFARAPKKLFADWEINNVYVAEGLQGWTKIYAYFFYGWSASLLMHDVPILRYTACHRRHVHFVWGITIYQWPFGHTDSVDLKQNKMFLCIYIQYKSLMNFFIIFDNNLIFSMSFLIQFFWVSLYAYFRSCPFYVTVSLFSVSVFLTSKWKLYVILLWMNETQYMYADYVLCII